MIHVYIKLEKDKPVKEKSQFDNFSSLTRQNFMSNDQSSTKCDQNFGWGEGFEGFLKPLCQSGHPEAL